MWGQKIDRALLLGRVPQFLIFTILGESPFPTQRSKFISGRGKGGEEGTTAHYRSDSDIESTLSLHLQVLDYGSPIINIYFCLLHNFER